MERDIGFTLIVYKAQNKINGKIYIGQSAKSLGERISRHISSKKKWYFQNALKKYGLQSFDFSVIDESDSQDILNEKEEYWISYYNSKFPSGYNLTDGGQGSTGFKHSEDSKKRIRESCKGKKSWIKGKHHSEKTKRKMGESNRGKPPWIKGKHHTEETKMKIRKSHRKRI